MERSGIEVCATSIFLDFAKLHRGYIAIDETVIGVKNRSVA